MATRRPSQGMMLTRCPGREEPPGRVLLAGGEAQLVLREDTSTLLAGRGEGHGARQEGDAVAGRQLTQRGQRLAG